MHGINKVKAKFLDGVSIACKGPDTVIPKSVRNEKNRHVWVGVILCGKQYASMQQMVLLPSL
jgi:hypothetical protein